MAKRRKIDTSALMSWDRPDYFLSRSETIRQELPAYDELVRSGMNELLDALTAGQFATAYARQHQGSKVEVKLGDPTKAQTDFQIRLEDGTILYFEATEADAENRKRGDEYKAKQELLKRGEKGQSELFDPDNNSKELRARLPVVVAAKVKKARARCKRGQPAYQDDTGHPLNLRDVNLLVRVNLMFHGLSKKECADLTRNWSNEFCAIWILDGSSKVVRLWPN